MNKVRSDTPLLLLLLIKKWFGHSPSFSYRKIIFHGAIQSE